jgi:hypothetical protein
MAQNLGASLKPLLSEKSRDYIKSLRTLFNPEGRESIMIQQIEETAKDVMRYAGNCDISFLPAYANFDIWLTELGKQEVRSHHGRPRQTVEELRESLNKELLKNARDRLSWACNCKMKDE